MTIESHPLRAALSAEMHARRLPRLDEPASIVQHVVLTNEQEAAANLARLRDALAAAAVDFDIDSRHIACSLSGMTFVWERHSEFMCYTFIVSGAVASGGALFDPTNAAFVATWLGELHGFVIRATHARLVRDAPDENAIADAFGRDDLVVSDAVGGAARIWCDFRLHADGAGRLLIHDKGMIGAEASQLLQRLQELGNYRKMALLGLPVAQGAISALAVFEDRLSDLAIRVADEEADDAVLLDELSGLCAELARMTSATGYRMSATRAYADLCTDRLRRLAMIPVRGYVSFDDFTERRLLPAMRTCEAFSRRLDDLSKRAEWTSALLRTRVDTAINRRNRDLLASMDRRTALQLRLQHTVEGLSVVAVSYYGAGLLHYVRTALEPAGIHWPPWSDLLVIPLILAVTWLGIRGLKRASRDVH